MLDDTKLMKSLLDTILKAYGWKANSVRDEIKVLVDTIRLDERKRFARFFHQLLLDNQHLTVGELLERVKTNDHCRADAISK